MRNPRATYTHLRLLPMENSARLGENRAATSPRRGSVVPISERVLSLRVPSHRAFRSTKRDQDGHTFAVSQAPLTGAGNGDAFLAER